MPHRSRCQGSAVDPVRGLAVASSQGQNWTRAAPYHVIMSSSTIGPAWKSYEDVARYLLNEIATVLDLERVEGEQSLAGRSGATWKVEGKGIKTGEHEGFLILECRRYT